MRDGAIAAHAAEIHDRARADWRHAESTIARGLRALARLHSRDRRAAGDAVWSVVRWHVTLERLAPGAGAVERVRLAADLDAGRSELLASALARTSDPVERLALSASLPAWLAARLVVQVGEAEAAAFATSLLVRAPLCVRANVHRIDRDALAARLAAEGVRATPAPLARHGLILEGHANVRALAAFKEGLLEIQDEGSQVVAERVAPPERAVVVDACAGAGGKTVALASQMGGRGRLFALDPDAAHLHELARRARAAGLTNVEPLRIDPDAPAPPALVARADRVLVDAPCSGTGVLRRHPAWRWSLAEADVAAHARRQIELGARFAACVRAGGRLVYATCSVLAEEDEQVARALAKATGFTLVDEIRLWPHRDCTDGFYVARFSREV